MRSSRALFGSKRSRFFKEPKKRIHKMSFRRKQSVKIRSRYAESLAREWGKRLVKLSGACLAAGALGGTVFAATHFWKTSSYLRVKTVVFEHDVPSAIRLSFPIKPNANLLTLRPGRLEKEIRNDHPELKDFTIRRWPNRIVEVSGAYRTPIAFTKEAHDLMGIDEDGVVFPLTDIAAPEASLPTLLTADDGDRAALLLWLSQWKKESPSFSSLVKKIETDRMRNVQIECTDGVLIKWGSLDNGAVVELANRVLDLKQIFRPIKTPAQLTIVANDRIVMDPNWIKIATVPN